VRRDVGPGSQVPTTATTYGAGDRVSGTGRAGLRGLVGLAAPAPEPYAFDGRAREP